MFDEQRLDLPSIVVEAPPPGAAPAGMRTVCHLEAHLLAFEPLMRERAAAASYYPDHVIFLGPAARLDSKPTAPDGLQKLPEQAPSSADEMALCLALVLQRVPAAADLVPLGAEAEAGLLNWEAERYRQVLTATVKR